MKQPIPQLSKAKKNEEWSCNGKIYYIKHNLMNDRLLYMLYKRIKKYVRTCHIFIFLINILRNFFIYIAVMIAVGIAIML